VSACNIFHCHATAVRVVGGAEPQNGEAVNTVRIRKTGKARTPELA